VRLVPKVALAALVHKEIKVSAALLEPQARRVFKAQPGCKVTLDQLAPKALGECKESRALKA
tara:strand:+ start:332 stop:517 length:186 start_codon:yes stop_codon:yes gene_type:complete